MRIRALQSLRSGLPSLSKGGEATVDDAVGLALIRANIAVLVHGNALPDEITKPEPVPIAEPYNWPEPEGENDGE